MRRDHLEGLFKQDYKLSHPELTNSVDLGRALEFTFLVSSQMMLMLRVPSMLGESLA